MQRRRVLLEDARGADRHLRVTWHPEAGQFNVSTWHGDVCVGAVRVEAHDAAALITLLADGMAETITTAAEAATTDLAPVEHSRWRIWLDRGLRHLRRSA